MIEPFKKTLDMDLNSLSSDIDGELVRLLFSMMPVVLVANLVNGTLIAAVFFRSTGPPLAAVWWLLLVTVLAARGVLWVRYRRHNGSSRRWSAIAIAGSATSGIVWGSTSFLFLSPGSETQQMVLGFILGGMGAGAVTALTPCLPAFYVYLFLTVVPFCVQLTLQGDADHLTMAAACMMYLIALTILGRKANMWLKESVLRRFENAELVRSLERRVDDRTTELRHVNEQLCHDIAERRRAEAALAKHSERQAVIAHFGRLALSGIDLDWLFGKAVELVRDQLEVAGAAVIEQPLDVRNAALRAAIGLKTEPSAEQCVGLTDHSQGALGPSAGDLSADVGPVDLKRLRDLKMIAEAVISQNERQFGVLLAVDVTAHSYSANDISFLQSIANMLAAAIERKRAEDDVQRLALQDPLTGLPNRGLFQDYLQRELARANRLRRMFAVLLLDLDHFKDVNDTLGHPIGDRLLVAVAERLRASLRATDAAARLGGDEFAIILSEIRSPEDAAAVARKVVDSMSEPFKIEGHVLHIGVSVGITISPDDSTDVDGLLRNADLALYRAKAEGRNIHRFFGVEMAVRIEARKAIERDLRRALERDELFLVYQPQFDLVSDRAIGAEALLRWQHSTCGLLLPDEFIPVAEATGLIVPLGRWVLQRVAEQTLEWRKCRLPRIRIAANVSLSQCRRGDLLATVREIALGAVGDFDWLEIEVTEHLFLTPESGDAVATLQHLSDLGVKISIDDFGAGYSSLGRLRELPVNKVKIDKRFIADLGIRHDAEKLVRAIIALAKSLDITVTGEGVESDYQLDFLIAEGCDCVQGYRLSPPLPHQEFAAMLRNDCGNYRRLKVGRTDCP